MKIEDADTGPLCDACSARLDRDGLIKDEDLYARCAAKLNIPAMTPELIDTSAKILRVMARIPNGHVVVMYNATTRAVTFIGCKQIADNPALYDGAVAPGSVAIAFFAPSYSIATRTPGMVGFDATVSKCPWCPFTDAELQESCQAWMSAIGARSSAAN